MKYESSENITVQSKKYWYWILIGIGLALLSLCSLAASAYIFRSSLLLMTLGILMTLIASAIAARFGTLNFKSRSKLDFAMTIFLFVFISFNIGLMIPAAIDKYGLNKFASKAREIEETEIELKREEIEAQLSEIQRLRTSLDGIDVDSDAYRQAFAQIDEKIGELANDVPWLEAYTSRMGEDRQHVRSIEEVDSILWLARIYIDV